MLRLNFERWAASYGSLFKMQRVYLNGTTWTPLVSVSFRYKGA